MAKNKKIDEQKTESKIKKATSADERRDDGDKAALELPPTETTAMPAENKPMPPKSRSTENQPTTEPKKTVKKAKTAAPKKAAEGIKKQQQTTDSSEQKPQRTVKAAKSGDSPTKSITTAREIKMEQSPVDPQPSKEGLSGDLSPQKAITPEREISSGENPVAAQTAPMNSEEPKKSTQQLKEKTTKKSAVKKTRADSKSANKKPEAEPQSDKPEHVAEPKIKSRKSAASAKNKESETASTPPKRVRKTETTKSVGRPKEVKISFVVRFRTNFGQSLFVSGDHDLLGNNDLAAALPMQYLDEGAWRAEITINPATFSGKGITYNYVLKDKDGSLSIDWGKDKKITREILSEKEVVFIDYWNYAGYPENVFFTEPFQKVLLASEPVSVERKPLPNPTHVFRAKAPLLKDGQLLCLSGNFNNWDQRMPLLMQKSGKNDYFEVAADLSDVSGLIIYKYGIYDIVNDSFQDFETGENRVLNPPTPSVKTIINDGFASLPSTMWRGAGVTVPVFSLRSEKSEGVGDFSDIKKLADWAAETGLKLIQLLPVNDTTITYSWQDSYPYSTISSFALHPIYLRVTDMVSASNQSVLEPYLVEFKNLNKLPTLDYESVLQAKWKAIREVYPLQKDEVFGSTDYKSFFENNKHWLVPYAAFCFYRDQYKSADFDKWPAHSIYHESEAARLLDEESEHYDEAAIHLFTQYYLHLQLKEAAEYTHAKGVILKGDIPIGVSRYGADAWQHPDLFHMDMQAGAPPDDFAKTGQNWGFPTYNWEVMQRNGFQWWRQRFDQMSNYFDSFRIDHILGFFRIWSIPYESAEGIMGHFEPAIPVYLKEFYERNIWFDYKRYCLPFINHQTLVNIFGDQTVYMKSQFLDYHGNDHYEFKEQYNTQRKIIRQFETWDQNEHNNWMKYQLLQLLGNVILFEVRGSNGQEFHFRFNMDQTTSYQWLDDHTKNQLKDLYINYFFKRQDDFWLHSAMQKLPPLKRETNMMVCGEDLGLVPEPVPILMHQLGILSLEIQRMPKKPGREFFDPANAPYLSVVMPSTHDMSTIRAWWEEDRERTERFYNNELHHQGYAPYFCDAWVNKAIVMQHLNSPAIWSIFQIQDIFGINRNIRRLDPHQERINDPSVNPYYWNYRIHLTLEKLLESKEFNDELKESLKMSGRA